MTGARTRHAPAPIQWAEERHESKELKNLYTTGTHLAEVSPAFEGIEYSKWKLLKVTEQCSQISRVFLAQFPNGVPDDTARALDKRLYTKRDGYGMKGVR